MTIEWPILAGVAPLSERIRPQTPQQAREHFLWVFEEYAQDDLLGA